MMNRLLSAIFLLLLLVTTPFAKFVAVLETISDDKDLLTLSERHYLTNMLREQAVLELPAELNWTIMTRENILMMLPPGKSIEECEGSCLAETGKNISADYVAQARIGRVGTSISISAELYETASSKLVASFNGLGTDVNALMEVIKAKSPEFFRKARGGATGIIRTSMDGHGNQSFVVNVSTNPSGAALSIDGRPIPQCAATPCKILVEAGSHRFVAVLEHHEDGEGQFAINENGQDVSINLVPRYGTLNLDFDFKMGGNYEDLNIKVDGRRVKASKKVLMDPGTHEVSISHRCYASMSFKIGMFKDKEETFKESLKPIEGGLSLKAHSIAGVEQSLPVYVRGTKVGQTPYLGTIPVCSNIEVEDSNGRQKIDVTMNAGEVTEYDYVVREKERVIPDSSNGDLISNNLKIGESIPTNVEQPQKKSRTGLRIASGVVSALGIGTYIFSEIMMKRLSEREPSEKKEYDSRLDNIHTFMMVRGIGLITGSIGLVGLGLTFVF
ncbi:PEGA domain-containing protein [Fibrobacter succinogenes]|uniref:PEGA domain-containing protein n=1 Tax=Fibrobacter succinogenes TaxID=833 RepID=UPI0015685425|nr:PEGA domain-containing protein [Fibrobacter succinogenes]